MRRDYCVTAPLFVALSLGACGHNDDDDSEAVFEAYHAGLVPPFCLSAAKSFFDAR